MNRESIIIPNNDLLNVPVVYRKINEDERHTLAIKEFSQANGLGLDFDGYYGYRWQQALASLGHAFITIEDTVVVFLPEVMSLNQIFWFNENKNFFVKVRNNMALQVVDSNGNVLLSEDFFTIQENEEANNVFKLMYKIIKKQASNVKVSEVQKR